MRRSRRRLVPSVVVVALLTAGRLPGDGPPASPPETTPATDAGVTHKHLYSGRVVRLGDALRRRGIPCGPETEGHVVLETSAGRLIPILADWRGRAFYQDERLRNRPVQIVANRRADVGYLQPLMVFTFDEQGRCQFTDYWCDVCSIPMYEIKPCECCQGEIRIRYTPQSPPEDVPLAEAGDRPPG